MMKMSGGYLPMTIDRNTMETLVPFIIPAICLVTGAILLCSGALLLKSAVGLSFGLLGAGTGLLLAPHLSLSMSPLIIALVFGVIAAILAVYLSKLAILLSLAFSFAIIAPVITWHVADLGNGEQVVGDVIEAATTPAEQSEASDDHSATTLQSSEDILLSMLTMVTHDVAAATRSGMHRANAAWNAIPAAPRLMLVGSSIAGLLLGLLVATFMPYFSAALVTSMGGSFLLLEGIRTIAAMYWNSNELSSITPTVLLSITIGLSLAGLGFQLTRARKSASVKRAAE